MEESGYKNGLVASIDGGFGKDPDRQSVLSRYSVAAIAFWDVCYDNINCKYDKNYVFHCSSEILKTKVSAVS